MSFHQEKLLDDLLKKIKTLDSKIHASLQHLATFPELFWLQEIKLVLNCNKTIDAVYLDFLLFFIVFNGPEKNYKIDFVSYKHIGRWRTKACFPNIQLCLKFITNFPSRMSGILPSKSEQDEKISKHLEMYKNYIIPWMEIYIQVPHRKPLVMALP